MSTGPKNMDSTAAGLASPAPETTDKERRGAGLRMASSAIRQQHEDDLPEVLAALGILGEAS